MKRLKLNGRLIVAISLSVAVHVVLLLVYWGQLGVQGAGAGRELVVTMKVAPAIPAVEVSETPSLPVTIPADILPAVVNAASAVAPSGIVGSRYYLSNEVDKKSDFIYSAPLTKLERTIKTDVEINMRLRVLINESGTVDSVLALDGEQEVPYKEEVRKALLKSRFSPAEISGIKVKTQKVIEIKFTLQNAD